MTIKKKIKSLIEGIIQEQYYKSYGREICGIEVLVEAPTQKSYGDYSTNIALVLAKKLNRNPLEVANQIVSKIKLRERPTSPKLGLGLEKVEAVGPGFINFYLSRDFFTENIKKIGKDFGKNNNLKGKEIIVEYTDPNILKEFHIGHLMSNTIGESIARLFEFEGARVKRANYQGDVGLHVAKAIWGKLKNPKKSWQESYVAGEKAYEEGGAGRSEIIELNKKIFERSDKNITKLYDKGRKDSLKYFEKIYRHLGTKFDFYFFESQTAPLGKKIVEKNLGKVFEKGEKGAIVFKGEKYGLHTRVFVNSEGLPTYEAKDLALSEFKFKKYRYDTSVIVTANEQNYYFKVLLAAMSEIFPQLSKKTKHIGHGIMRLPEGKMASRTGMVVRAESLIGKAKEMIAKKLANRDFSEKEKEKISGQVAIGAIKYSILKQAIGSDIVYDFEKSISFEGNSGPYLQYSYVRANSILRKAKSERVKIPANYEFFRIANSIEIGGLEKMMIYFPEIVEKAKKEYAPHLMITYLTELAREFNNYYAKEKIVDKKDKLSPYRVTLTRAFSIIMKNGLWLLGISAPEKM